MESDKHAAIGRYIAKCHSAIGQEVVSCTDWCYNRHVISGRLSYSLLYVNFFSCCLLCL